MRYLFGKRAAPGIRAPRRTPLSFSAFALLLCASITGCDTSSQLEPDKLLAELNPGAQAQLCRFTVDLLVEAPFAACRTVPPWSNDFGACRADFPWDECGPGNDVGDWEACVLVLNDDPCGDTAACDGVLCTP